MVFQDENEVIEVVKALQSVPNWVNEARKVHNKYRALKYGDDYLKLLIEKIEKIESADRADARKKYSKDIRDMFGRVFEPRQNVFNASGGSFSLDIASNPIKEKVIYHIDRFKGNKSIHKYLSEYFFELLDVDPNGVIFMEYVADEKIYPTYKSICDIRYYESNGQNIEFIVFEPKPSKSNPSIYKWRVVDSENDYTVIQNGQTFVIDSSSTFNHPFDEVPGIVLSDYQKLGTELRFSPMFEIEQLSEEYARDKSVLMLYKFIHGFPIHWRYTQICRRCHGTGRDGENACGVCDGKGHLGKNDVTDILEVPMPRDSDDIKIAPDLAGFVSPDIKTWEQYRIDLEKLEKQIEDTIWGTHRINESKSETATGRFIDVQPVMNKLNSYADNVEWVHEQLLKWVIQWANGSAEAEYSAHVAYGRGFIIESPDVLLKRYEDNRSSGSNWTVLDKLLNEYLSSKYRNNPQVLEIEQKKIRIEPYLHLSFKETKEIYGSKAANQKMLFGQFWQEADKNKTVNQLKAEFDKYILQSEDANKLSESDKTNNALNLLSPLVATKVLEELSSEEIRSLIGKDGSNPNQQSNP